MTAIQGVHPYADKFPMLPESDKTLNGISQDPQALIWIHESDDLDGYFEVNISTAGEIISFKRPVRGSSTGRKLIQSFIEKELGQAKIQWTYRRRTPKQEFPCQENVYFICDEDGYIKIGFARSVQSRLDMLQTASRQELRLIASMPGNLSDEKSLHKRFEEDHARGEWFYPSTELNKYIKENAQ